MLPRIEAEISSDSHSAFRAPGTRTLFDPQTQLVPLIDSQATMSRRQVQSHWNVEANEQADELTRGLRSCYPFGGPVYVPLGTMVDTVYSH